MSAPGTHWYRALDRYAHELAPGCDAQPSGDNCPNPATWAVSLGPSIGLACDQCKTDIDRARFGKPAGLRWEHI